MNINYLIELLTNRLSSLTLAKDQAFSSGDLERINTIEAEIFGVQDTLTKLKLLQSASQEAAATNSTLIEAMKIQANIITNGSTECMNEYDISSYATDPLHEQKIADILSYMGTMISVEAINTYIDSEAIGSPITGQMVLNAAQAYSVDVRLMMAIMELDSRFGTAGVAVNTLNPGNVGNDGTNTRTYSSWEEGVMAVAKWLNNHKITTTPVQDSIIKLTLASLLIVPKIANITVGNTQQLSTNALDQKGDTINDASVTFMSSDSSIATVDDLGVVTAVSAGSAIISVEATSDDNVVTSDSVITVYPVVVPALASIIITPTAVNITSGQTQQFTANPLDQNGNIFTSSVVTFSSDDIDVATVDNVGLVTAVSAGTANVTAQAISGDITVTEKSIVTVSEPETSPVVDPTSTDTSTQTPNTDAVISMISRQTKRRRI